jgi:lambda repressor-like predicted transcriptional regulator
MLNKESAMNADAPLYIREWLRHRGLSVTKAAEKLGIEPHSLHRCIKQQHRLNVLKMEDIADVLGIKVQELWHPPGHVNLNAILADTDDETREKAASIVRCLNMTKSKVAHQTNGDVPSHSSTKQLKIDEVLHSKKSPTLPAGRVDLVDVLKRIPRERRKAAFDAAIQEIDAAERRASLEQSLKDKVATMSSDELEQFINGGA